MSEPVIGIDLGTTFSAVATVEGGRPRLIPTRAGGRLTPSMVGFTKTGERVVGERARLLSEAFPEHVAYATKRFIGRRHTPELSVAARAQVPYQLLPGPSGEVRIKVAGRILPLTQVSAMILGELKLDAEAYFGRPVTKAVVTVPANFDDAQRTATKEAARIAGLDVLRIINEPTAAAVAYGLTEKFEGRALVFDLGGGTFDVSILEVEKGVFQVKATGGDPLLGGEDFDNRIVQWLIAQLPEPFREAVSKDKLSLMRLKIASEKAKRELTEREEAYISVFDLGDQQEKKLTSLETALTRTFFHQLSEPLTRRCLEVCQRVMSEAAVDPKSMNALLLVGGMTRVPLVRQLAADFFGRHPVSGVNPDEVVALGAAVQAAELAGKSGQALLIDVVGHSFGVGVLGGVVRKLITKNTPVPVVAKEVFLPGRHGQTQARIPVFQGESEYADEATKLGELVLHELNVIHRAEVPIEVSFELSNEGTLSVRAVDMTTGLAEAIRIEARTELSPTEVEKLSREQTEYAKAARGKDAEAATESFKRVLDKAEKFCRLLEKSAQENPSPEAEATVARVRSVVEMGRVALRQGQTVQMAEMARTLKQLLGAPS